MYNEKGFVLRDYLYVCKLTDTTCIAHINRMYVCMVIIYSKGKDHPGKVANPARGQLNREN